MATKKKTEDLAPEVEAVEEVKAPKAEKTVKIKIPRERDNKEDAVFVSVNERTWLIKKGIEVEVPECVAKVLELREKALDEAYDYESEKAK